MVVPPETSPVKFVYTEQDVALYLPTTPLQQSATEYHTKETSQNQTNKTSNTDRDGEKTRNKQEFHHVP